MKKTPAFLIFVVFGLLSLFQCSAPKNYFKRQVIRYRLGDRRIRLIRYDFDNKPVVWFNMHDDENTAVKAGRRSINHGRLWEIRHRGGRNIYFRFHGKRYGFDPNRIFTPGGRKKTLQKFSHSYSVEADSVVAHFAQFLIRHVLADAVLVVTLHNNTRGRYSIKSYLPGARFASDAAEVNVASGQDADDFFYCTDSTLYYALKARGWNALLQNNEAVSDDGSLSVYCGQNRMLYVNIEAQRGHRRVQQLMIEDLQKVLDSLAMWVQ